MADILTRLVQKADSLSALQLTGALFTINSGTLRQTHLPPDSSLPLPPASAPAPPPLTLFGPLRRPWSQKAWPFCESKPGPLQNFCTSIGKGTNYLTMSQIEKHCRERLYKYYSAINASLKLKSLMGEKDLIKNINTQKVLSFLEDFKNVHFSYIC